MCDDTDTKIHDLPSWCNSTSRAWPRCCSEYVLQRDLINRILVIRINLAGISQSVSHNFISPEVKFWRQKFTRFNFGWGSTPDPTGELTMLPKPPSQLWRGTPLPQTLLLDAFCVSISVPSAPRNVTSYHFPPTGFRVEYHPGYIGRVTIFSWMFTVACCLVVGLGLGLA